MKYSSSTDFVQRHFDHLVKQHQEPYFGIESFIINTLKKNFHDHSLALVQEGLRRHGYTFKTQKQLLAFIRAHVTRHTIGFSHEFLFSVKGKPFLQQQLSIIPTPIVEEYSSGTIRFTTEYAQYQFID